MTTQLETKMSLEEIKQHLSDRWWRINNLYYIMDEKGNKVIFKPNSVQKEIYDNLWFMNIVPKARQLGVCLDPKTKILTADLRWVAIGDLKIGEKIVSVDEYPKEKRKGVARKMRTGEVEAVVRLKRETYKITFDDGRILICTGKHPWLAKKTNPQLQWMTIEGLHKNKRKNKLTVGAKVRWVTKPWDNNISFEDGWFGGMLDGEGSMAKSNRPGVNIGVSQKEGNVLDRMIKYVDNRGYKYRIEIDKRKPGISSKFGAQPIYKIVLSQMSEIFRLLGQARPTRFIDNHFWEGKEMPTIRETNNPGACWATIISIESLGMREVIDLQTSIGTYIAEGFVSHNTTFFSILYLDQILFSENKIAGIIAHRQEDMKKIFRNKIKFAWDNLHPWVKEKIGSPNTDSAYEMSFPNGSVIFVSMSTRSATPQFLHISEFGYICQKYPDKAEEIVSGAMNSVHVGAGSMISIESTAAGREGRFYEFCMEAERARKEGRELSAFDFKMFFFPWWVDSRYRLAGNFIIPTEDQEYFKNLEKRHGIKLDGEQKTWYSKKKKINKDKMYQEYPSTLDEAFSVSTEGAYYAKEMEKVYSQRRIMVLPHEKLVKVDTWWDLGMNDFNIILLTQTVGPQIRFIDMYYNRGESLAHYYDWLKTKKEEMGYSYGTHNFPWDLEVKELGTGISRRETLVKLGMNNIRVAPKPSIQDGIDRVRTLFPKFYFDEEKCQKLHEALFNYRKAFDSRLGVFKDKPRHDENSHFCFSGDTIIKTKEGDKKISEIKEGEFVDSPFGWTKVLWSGITGKNEIDNFLGMEITGNHPILTKKGFVAIDTVRTHDKIMVCKKEVKQLRKKLFTMGLDLEDTQNPIGESVGFIFNLLSRIKQVIKRKDYIDIYGKKKKVKFLKDMLFIIKMVIHLIMNYRTWNVYQIVNIYQNICLHQKELNKARSGLRLREFMPQNGMAQKRGLNFISGSVKKVGRIKKLTQNNACIAEKTTKPIFLNGQNTAVENVKVKPDIYNLKTESGVFYVNGILVSNCDAVRTLGLLWREIVYTPDQERADMDQTFF